MKTIGKLLNQVAAVLMLLILPMMAALAPVTTASAAVAAIDDNFNRCTLDPVWDDQTGIHADPVIAGAYQGDSAVTLTVAPGAQSTISGTNQNASRIMQEADEQSFELEVRFLSPLGLTSSSGIWRMQGILVRDNTDPDHPKWLRFDLNTNHETINFYAGYTDENQVTTHFTGKDDPGGVSVIGQSDANSAGTKIRLKFDAVENRWSMRYYMPVRGWSTYEAFTFTEAAPTRGNPFTFTITDIGIFSGSTGSTPPGHTAHVDYFYMGPQANDFQDDTVLLSVTTDGPGTVNWPAGAVCTGNQVTLTATPDQDAAFNGWSGDVTSPDEEIILTMTQSYNLLATFIPVIPIEQPYIFYIPYVTR